MYLLFLEIWFYLLVAFLLGMFVQWFFCCRIQDQANSKTPKNSEKKPINTEPITDLDQRANVSSESSNATMVADNNSTDKVNAAWRPQHFSQPPEVKDELKRIKGIGAVIENTLNELGVYTFKQIAEWDDDNVAWVENFLAFQGRVKREEWVSQAKTLASGGITDFSRRVDKGEVDY